jgi:hypothetical protein
MSEPQPQPRTVGDALSGMRVDRAAMLGGAVLAVIGSIGPWVTSPLSSASGTDGDGVITLIAALVFGVAALRTRGLRGLALIAILVTGGVAIYDLIHIGNEVRRITFGGAQIDHVGWGVYVVIAGAVVALLAWIRGRDVQTAGPREVPTPPPDVPSPLPTDAQPPSSGFVS